MKLFGKAKDNGKKQPHPLNKDAVIDLLTCEDLLVSGIISKQKIEHLLDIYRVCAEYYDSVRDPMSLYFTEKIQKAVSNKTVLHLFLKGNEETAASRKRKNTEENLKKMLGDCEEKSKKERRSS